MLAMATSESLSLPCNEIRSEEIAQAVVIACIHRKYTTMVCALPSGAAPACHPKQSNFFEQADFGGQYNAPDGFIWSGYDLPTIIRSD